MTIHREEVMSFEEHEFYKDDWGDMNVVPRLEDVISIGSGLFF
jgi:hypothetical protein